MTIMDDYLKRIEEHEIPELRKQLAPLEAGTMHIKSRTAEQPEWEDITQQHIDFLRRSIKTYEGIIAHYSQNKI
jgi:hypothetical protein